MWNKVNLSRIPVSSVLTSKSMWHCYQEGQRRSKIKQVLEEDEKAFSCRYGSSRSCQLVMKTEWAGIDESATEEVKFKVSIVLREGKLIKPVKTEED